MGGTRGDQNMPSGKEASAARKHRLYSGQDRGRLRQSSRANFSTGHRAQVRFEYRHPVGPQLGDIAAGSGMPPHAHIHRRCDHHGLVSREKHVRGEIIGDAAGHAGEEVRGAWGDHHQVRITAQLDMPNLGFVLQIPKRRMDWLARERRERHRCDEMRAARSQNAAHVHVRLPHQADELTGFIGSNAAANDQQNARLRHAHFSSRPRNQRC